LSHAPGRVG